MPAASSIREDCKLEADEVARLRADPTGFVDGASLYAFMVLVARSAMEKRGGIVAVVSPYFSGMLNAPPGVKRHQPIESGSARQMTWPTAIDWSSSGLQPDVLAIPVHKTHTHWVLGIWVAAAKKIFFYDPLHGKLNAWTAKQLRRAVRDFIAEDDDEPAIEAVPFGDYNAQRDGHNCGIHVCLIWERFLQQPHQPLLIDGLVIAEERVRILDHVERLLDSDDVRYEPVKPNAVDAVEAPPLEPHDSGFDSDASETSAAMAPQGYLLGVPEDVGDEPAFNAYADDDPAEWTNGPPTAIKLAAKNFDREMAMLTKHDFQLDATVTFDRPKGATAVFMGFANQNAPKAPAKPPPKRRTARGKLQRARLKGQDKIPKTSLPGKFNNSLKTPHVKLPKSWLVRRRRLI